MIVLGLNAFGHDAAAVLIEDGRTTFASSEERYDRQRHSAAFPALAIEAALAGRPASDVDLVAFPWTRSMAFGAKAWHVVRHLPRSLAFLRERPEGDLPGRAAYLHAMRSLKRTLRDGGMRAPLVRVPHHKAHAASARLALPAGRGAIVTADGMGEWTTAATWRATESTLTPVRRTPYPHSAGKAYAAVTQWLGFRPESGEGKTMGLAPLGDPRADGALFAADLLAPHSDDLLRVKLSAFDFPWGRRRLYGDAFVRSLGPPRDAERALRPGDADVARGIQDAVERTFLDVALRHVEETGAHDLALAGGLFLNCALNGVLLRALDAHVHPFPVAGDAGAAWGAAAWAYEHATGQRAERLETVALGHDLDDAEAARVLGADAPRPKNLAEEVASRVADGRLVGVARGRAEFGPRALGCRSILASPGSIEIRDRLNAHKGREAWRPLAPVVREDAQDLFRDLVPSPWMILTFVATDKARRLVPGGIHVDGTARVQTIGANDDTLLGSVLEALSARGEPPAVLNTSFNRRGEPIVNTAEEALASARAMRLDAVVLGDRLVDLQH